MTSTSDQRKQSLSTAISREVSNGFRVESQSDYQAILVKGKKTNHILHLILTLVTVGFWAIVWIIVALANSEKRLILQVDDYGNVLKQAP